MTDGEFDRFVMASMFGTPASEVPRVRAYVEALRRRLADTEAAIEVWRRNQAHDAARAQAAEARLAEVEAERDEWKQRSREQRARAQAAEDRVRALTEALTMIVIAYDGYMETDVLDDLPIAIGFARAVLGSETSGEGTE